MFHVCPCLFVRAGPLICISGDNSALHCGDLVYSFIITYSCPFGLLPTYLQNYIFKNLLFLYKIAEVLPNV